MNDLSEAATGTAAEQASAACDLATLPAGDFYSASGLLTRYWYVAARSADLRPGRPLSARLFGRGVVLMRSEGRVVAFPDQCLHRGSALSAGRVENGCLRCPYHGWAFDADGAVVDVPSLPPGAPLPRARLRRLPAEERDGLIWICPGDGTPLNTPFSMPYHDDPAWVTYYMVTDFDNNVVNLAENFMDVPHTVFVHEGIFRSRQRVLVESDLEVTPGRVHVNYRHAGDSIGLFPWLLNPQRAPLVHTDAFHGPNVTRCDYHFGDASGFVITSQMTPLDPMRTRVYTLISYKLAAARALARVVRPLMHAYTRLVIQQDVRIMRVQRQGLANGPVQFHSTGADRVHIEIKRMVDAQRAKGTAPGVPGGPRPMRFMI